MMDEQLIDEVAQHGVIYNRQKYYLNGSGSGGGPAGSGANGGNKYETKDEAWQLIAMKLRSDVETCKKRWKYLRERYVSQRKQGDPPVYEHLSRPYLEKMKFLDQHIQPRKSYRNVPNFLTSPHSANSSNFGDYNMDSKSNSSNKNINHFGGQHHPYHQQQDQQHTMNALSTAAAAASALEGANNVKIEADQVFRDFAAAVASQQLQQISQTQMHHQAAAVAAAMADSSQNYSDHFRETSGTAMGNNNGAGTHNNVLNATGAIPSSSSSIKSPLSSPLTTVNGGHSGGHSTTTAPQQVAAHSSSSGNANHMPNQSFIDSQNDDLDSSTGSNYNTKKPRVQLNPHQHASNMTSHHNNNHSGNNSNNHHHNGGNMHSLNTNNAHFVDDTDDDSDDNCNNLLQPQTILGEPSEHQPTFNSVNATTSGVVAPRSNSNAGLMGNNSNSNAQSGMFPSNADFLFQLYQQLPHQQHHQQNVASQAQNFNKFQAPQTPPQRSSEHLLGELVTTELLKMSRERRKNVQKRILEILFFDD